MTRVQAQLPELLAAAYANAEAQVQVHMAQVQGQVSEVSDINNHVYSANSPIAVC